MTEERAVPHRVRMPAKLSRRQLEFSRTDAQVAIGLLMSLLLIGMMYGSLAGAALFLFGLFCLFRWGKGRTYRVVGMWMAGLWTVKVRKMVLWQANAAPEKGGDHGATPETTTHSIRAAPSAAGGGG